MTSRKTLLPDIPTEDTPPKGGAIFTSAAFRLTLEAASKRRIGAGESIIVQGRTGKAAFFLAEGVVEVFSETPYGAVRLADLAAPRLIGEVGAFASLPRTASIRAASDVLVYRIGRDDLMALGKKEPDLLLSIIEELGRQLESLNRTISLYINALGALERSEFDPRILEDLNNPPPQAAAFTEAFRRFAEQIVSKRKQQEEMASAAAIQRSLLPDLDALAHLSDRVDLHATMRPARDIGGDFYDFFMLDANRLVVAVGDVCGKGLPASLFAAIVVTVVRTTVREESQLERAIARANAILCRDNSASLFATMFVGILNIETGDLEYCNCGHNPPLIVSKAGLKTLPATGLPLGLIDDRSACVARITMAARDALVVYSDGVTEALDITDQEFGDSRLEEIALMLLEQGAFESVKAIVDAVDQFSGEAQQADDITCAVVRRVQR